MSASVSHLYPRLRSLYRQLLRELPSRPHTHPSKVSSSILVNQSPLLKRIRSNFAHPTVTPVQPGYVQEKVEEAEQFIEYLKAQRMYATLVERYNPGMGMDEEERVRLSARRVGLNLPIEHKEDDN
jgi:ATP synthase assembly factor FMC1